MAGTSGLKGQGKGIRHPVQQPDDHRLMRSRRQFPEVRHVAPGRNDLAGGAHMGKQKLADS